MNSVQGDRLENANAYLSDSFLAMTEWYRKTLYYETGIYGSQGTSPLPDIDEIRYKFDAWVDKNIILLQQYVCHTYIHNKEKYSDMASLAIIIANSIDDKIAAPLEVACLLLKNGLDDLCLGDHF